MSQSKFTASERGLSTISIATRFYRPLKNSKKLIYCASSKPMAAAKLLSIWSVWHE